MRADAEGEIGGYLQHQINLVCQKHALPFTSSELDFGEIKVGMTL